MKYLLDTHLLLWAAATPDRLSVAAHNLINDPVNDCIFSVVSLWEITIKHSLGRNDFRVDASLLRHELMNHGYQELAIYAKHVLNTSHLANLHKDPFDRLLVAQASAEAITLLTADAQVSAYLGPILYVG